MGAVSRGTPYTHKEMCSMFYKYIFDTNLTLCTLVLTFIIQKQNSFRIIKTNK